MRTWGRVLQPDQVTLKWMEVSTDANGSDDYVWLTTLIQVLKLQLGESPFYGNYGIPSRQAVMQQIMPDFYVARTQQQFASHFASLMITRIASRPPTYKVNVMFHNGTVHQEIVGE